MRHLLDQPHHILNRHNLDRLPQHLRLHQQANLVQLQGKPVVDNLERVVGWRFESDSEQMLAAGHVQQVQEFHLRRQVRLECVVNRALVRVVQQIKARLREGNLLIQVYRKSGPLGVCPCQRYSQSALYHGVWIGRIQIRRVWIGQGRNNAVHVEDQVRATGWEYGPGVELGNQGNAPYGPNQGVQIFQGEARKIGRDRSPCQELHEETGRSRHQTENSDGSVEIERLAIRPPGQVPLVGTRPALYGNGIETASFAQEEQAGDRLVAKPQLRKQRWLRRNRTACHPPAGASPTCWHTSRPLRQRYRDRVVRSGRTSGRSAVWQAATPKARSPKDSSRTRRWNQAAGIGSGFARHWR